jgi:phosphoribosyl 1,2-cyclic phosphodiesterase
MDGLKHTPHQSHFSYQQGFDACVELVQANGRGYLTGLSHHMDHDELESWLATLDGKGVTVKVCYDGQLITI